MQETHSSPPPSQTFPALFKKTHEMGVFEDAKTMSDIIPITDSKSINEAYKSLNNHSVESLRQFLHLHFIIPQNKDSDFKTNKKHSVSQHIHALWNVLRRAKDKQIEGSSLVPLPYSYVVPGGRFNEIYYWDSYFTMLGLKISGEFDLIESMIENFAHQIDQFGHIPNGNRTYFLSRSQPPFFALMVELLAGIRGEKIYDHYLPHLIKEYSFWMKGSEQLSDNQLFINRVGIANNKFILNRYYDELDTPRDEMYPDDVELAKTSNRNSNELFRHIRAACESGWDFSSRWLSDPMDLSSIDAAHIFPIDLNCLLYHLELTISKCHLLKGENVESSDFKKLANQRKKAINKVFWNDSEGCYLDFNNKKNTQTPIVSAATTYPLFFKIADPHHADSIALKIKNELLKPGGVRCTTIKSGQQWDAPNGWVPIQYIAVKGLISYDQINLALNIAKKWTSLNESIFKSTGKMLEKYNVEDLDLHAGGGEYPVQDGFGWTNGVYLALKEIMSTK